MEPMTYGRMYQDDDSDSDPDNPYPRWCRQEAVEAVRLYDEDPENYHLYSEDDEDEEYEEIDMEGADEEEHKRLTLLGTAAAA